MAEIRIQAELSHTGGTLFEVFHDDKRSGPLSYEEMLGLVSAMTIAAPERRSCLQWMQTDEQHDARRARLEGMTKESNAT
jgi:hypothetical protein